MSIKKVRCLRGFRMEEIEKGRYLTKMSLKKIKKMGLNVEYFDTSSYIIVSYPKCPVCCALLSYLDHGFYYCTVCDKEFKKNGNSYEEVNK